MTEETRHVHVGPDMIATGFVANVQHYIQAVMIDRRVDFKEALKDAIAMVSKLKQILEADLKEEESHDQNPGGGHDQPGEGQSAPNVP